MTDVSELAVYVLLAAMVVAVATDLLVLRWAATNVDGFPPTCRDVATNARTDRPAPSRLAA